MLRKFKKLISVVMAAAVMMTVSSPMTAVADDYYLTVVGNVRLSGGSGNVEDVVVSVRYGNITPGHEDTYMAKVVWTGSPNAKGRYAVQTEAHKQGLHVLRVTAELDGYKTVSAGLGIGQNSADLILVADESAAAYNVSGAITMNGSLISPELCPQIDFHVVALSQSKNLEACGGSYNCNAPAGSDVIITPTLEGYTFSPESIRIDKIGRDMSGNNFVMTKISTDEPEVPETDAPEPEAPEPEVPDTDSAEVIVYQHKDYGGKSLALKEGQYNMRQLSPVGNDAISSLKVPDGYTVILYEHSDYKGKTLTCTKDTPWLGSHKFNDLTSSIKVIKN